MRHPGPTEVQLVAPSLKQSVPYLLFRIELIFKFSNFWETPHTEYTLQKKHSFSRTLLTFHQLPLFDYIK